MFWWLPCSVGGFFEGFSENGKFYENESGSPWTSMANLNGMA